MIPGSAVASARELLRWDLGVEASVLPVVQSSLQIRYSDLLA